MELVSKPSYGIRVVEDKYRLKAAKALLQCTLAFVDGIPIRPVFHAPVFNDSFKSIHHLSCICLVILQI